MTALTGQRPTILLTRSDEDNALIAPLFEIAGLATVAVPGISIIPPDDWSPCDEAIGNLPSYDGIIFTSRRAVRSFLGRLDAIRDDGRSIIKGKKIAAVGKKTEEALVAEGIAADFVPDVGSARSLAASLGMADVRGRRYLFPKSDIARDDLPAELRAHEARVDEVIVYRTVLPDAGAVSDVRERLLAGSIGYAAFFSPSALRNILETFGIDCFQRTTIAAVGPTTAAAAEAAGLRAEIIAATPRTEDLVAAIREHAASGRTTLRKLDDA